MQLVSYFDAKPVEKKASVTLTETNMSGNVFAEASTAPSRENVMQLAIKAATYALLDTYM